MRSSVLHWCKTWESCWSNLYHFVNSLLMNTDLYPCVRFSENLLRPILPASESHTITHPGHTCINIMGRGGSQMVNANGHHPGYLYHLGNSFWYTICTSQLYSLIKTYLQLQVIYASTFNSQIRTFGWSLSGGMDMDNNDYPDLLVGAYDSGDQSLNQSSWRGIFGRFENNHIYPGQVTQSTWGPPL